MEKTTALSPFKTMQISTKTSFTSESKRGRRQKKHSSKSSSKSSYLKTNNNRSSPLENAKDELEVFCVQMNKGIDISEKEKEEVDERVKNVEKYYQSSLMSNTMENVANGYWRVIYSTAPPPSNGQLFGPICGTAFQSIDKEEKTYENVLALGNWLTLRLKATYEILENTNKTRWTVTFKSIQVELFEKKEPVFVKAFPKGTTREWLTTFQDDEWRIVRAGRTKEEISKNVFVMRREKPWWET